MGSLRYVRECLAGPNSCGLRPDFHGVEIFFACELLKPPERGLAPDPSQVGVEWLSIDDLRKRWFFPIALLDALSAGPEFGYLGVV